MSEDQKRELDENEGNELVVAEDEKEVELMDSVQQFAQSLGRKYGTPIQRKILAVKVIPEFRLFTVTKICGMLKIDRGSWYKNHANEKFRANCLELAKNIKAQYAPEIMKAFLATALSGDVRAQLAYLQDVGILESQDTKAINVNVAIVAGELPNKRRQIMERFGITFSDRAISDVSIGTDSDKSTDQPDDSTPPTEGEGHDEQASSD